MHRCPLCNWPPASARSCAFRPGPLTPAGVQLMRPQSHVAMPKIELDLPQVVFDAMNDAANTAGIPPAELLADALRTLPAFQRALAARPERLTAFSLNPGAPREQ